MFDDGGMSNQDSRMLDEENRRKREKRNEERFREVYFALRKLELIVLGGVDNETRKKWMNSAVV